MTQTAESNHSRRSERRSVALEETPYPTRVFGPTLHRRRAEYVVVPAHSRGAAPASGRLLGSLQTKCSVTTIRFEYPPYVGVTLSMSVLLYVKVVPAKQCCSKSLRPRKRRKRKVKLVSRRLTCFALAAGVDHTSHTDRITQTEFRHL